MKTNELREKYLEFFESKGHTRVASDVLVPTWDPSVLFTPAGMNQFKDHFLGKVKLDYTRATTCQKCMRTGDIDNVGRTPRHHTFFEMLGNFSFGDYFKREAIHWAWEFLTHKEWLGLPEDTLTVTVYKDDKEAADIWHEEIGLPTSRISYEDEDENFWPASAPSQGPDGVCGPCSEIYYTAPGREELEIWNLVFTQFNRVGDPPDNLRPLPSKNIDTGMGLERTAAALQNVETNFHIDTLMPIVQAAAEVCGVKYKYASEEGRRLRRITDHVRACAFAVHENVYPGPQKEKYVVKRLLRRAVLDGHQLGMREPFLCKLVPAVVDAMEDAYPELKETTKRVSDVIAKEEANFFGTIDGGLSRIEAVFDEMRRDNRLKVDGGVAADLYQTYGVPPELFESLAAEHNLAFDWPGYQHAMAEHGEASGKLTHTVMGAKGPIDSLKQALHKTEFVGYDALECEATVAGIIAGVAPDDHLCDSMEEVGHEHLVRVVLDKTPFYGESGGQVGDTGQLIGKDFEFEVVDTQKDGQLFVHAGHLKSGKLVGGATVKAVVDADRREAIARAHSATHLLHHALQKHLGSHAQQQGSKVDEDWLRFDFTNLSPVGADELAAIATDVKAYVEAGAPVEWETLPLAEARRQGAMMLFGEKYPDPVRMVSMGPIAADAFSRELCGGSHLTNTAQVASFEVLSEEGVSAGTRRIVALTGKRAESFVADIEQAADSAAATLGVSAGDLATAVGSLLEQQKSLKKAIAGGGHSGAAEYKSTSHGATTHEQKKIALGEAARLLSVGLLDVPDRVEAVKAEIASLENQLAEREEAGPLSADSLLEEAQTVAGATVVVAETRGATPDMMRKLIDAVRQKTQPSAILLASTQGDDKVTLVAGITKDLQDKGFSAGKWIGPVAKAVGGGGGGRPDMAQAGGKQPDKLPEALAVAKQTAAEMLGG
ncbi:Alanine--tRNA ligase [Posidoniimonas polymericola]|uniref:Alanine--tRNA ligase n=1 Tax=Posidoniimonas polymericola TaxID=2528002 RepID=A0A5C5ZFF6_9BACT|nr:alanine--tRNA ligase [Posidoniimonas polymericola]TWT85830.1 Alanine--tRNA ligase [Posidoniimonas polymericola]